MCIIFTQLDPNGVDKEDLINFLSNNGWPFHDRSSLTRDDVEKGIAAGDYRNDDNDSYWINHMELGRIGFFRLEDLTDRAPVFDLRLDETMRGRGLGLDVLSAATDFVFTSLPGINRFEGHTREDNIAMRKTFVRAGWVQEAHYREGWPVEGQQPLASVAYATLRKDWLAGTVTPVPWDDLDLTPPEHRCLGS